MEQLTVREAAKRLGISEHAVRKRVQRGTLPHTKPSDGHVYVYLDSETTEAGQALDSETSDVGQESSETEFANQVTLNYVDKLYMAWHEIDARHARFMLLLLANSVLVLAISGGAVSTEESLTVSGIGLRVPLAVFMIAGALLIPVLLLMIMNMESLRELYKSDIRSLYKNLGLTNTAMASRVSPFISRSFSHTLSFGYTLHVEPESYVWQDPTFPVHGRAITPRGRTLVLLALYGILPPAAQVGAGYKISELLDKGDIEQLGYKIFELFDKAPLGWFSEALAYIGQGIGEVVTFVFAFLNLPRQGSDWISDLFVILAFLSALMLLLPAYEIRYAEAPRRRRNLIIGLVRIAFYSALCTPFVWIGSWLGYLVAAS